MTYIYHGTSDRYLPDIERRGLVPRGKNEGNWEDFPSHPEMIYLSTAYPLYFATLAVENLSKERLVLVELELEDLDEEKLYPDEDAVAQSISYHEGRPLRAVHQEVIRDLDNYKDEWEKSLIMMGNVAHRGNIEPAMIRRVALVSFSKKRAAIFMSMLDPIITPLAYRHRGPWYEKFVRWVFGDESELPHLDDFRLYSKIGALDAGPAARRFWEAQSTDRSGIEVFQLGERPKTIPLSRPEAR